MPSPYTTIDLIELKTGEAYDADSIPTSTQIASIITESDAIIDHYVTKAGYSVPATTPGLIELISTLLSAASAEDSTYTQESNNESKRGPIWRKRAMELLMSYIESLSVSGGVSYPSDWDTDQEELEYTIDMVPNV